jgi:hypothetical protein
MQGKALLALLACSGMASTAMGVAFPEVEGNGTKGTANLFSMVGGDTITGTAGSTTSDPDYFRIRTSFGTPGIYLNTLTSSTSLVNMHIRGVNMGFVAGDANFGSARSPVKWYTVGSTGDNYVRAARGSSGSTSYTLTLAQTPITPTNAGSFSPGSIAISANLTGDSELYLFDSNFNQIAGNDNRSFTDTRALITQTLAAGTYYIAVGSGDSAGQTPYNTSDPLSPYYSVGTNAPTQIDPFFGGGIPLSTYARGENIARSATDYGITINGGSLIQATNGLGGLEMAFYTFEVIPSPSSLALLGLGGLVATRRRR